MFGNPNRAFVFQTRPQWREQQEGENTDSRKKQYRQRYPAVGPASSQHNLDCVGVENRSVDRCERRKRELRERFQSSRIFGVGIQRGEIGGHASEKKRWMKNADHQKKQIAIGLFDLELKKFVRAEQRQFQASNEDAGVKGGETKTQKQPAIKLPKT